MIPKASKLYSVLHEVCPRCHEGKMFSNGVFSSRFADMNERCAHCGLSFLQEPSFYFGAMYFSYAIQVAVFVVVYLALRYTINPDTWTYVIWMITAVVLILPLNFRISRVLWINLFVSYEVPANENDNK